MEKPEADNVDKLKEYLPAGVSMAGWPRAGYSTTTRCRSSSPGRSLEKARAFSTSTGGGVLPARLDIENIEADHEIFRETRLAIMCLDNKDARFIKDAPNGV